MQEQVKHFQEATQQRACEEENKLPTCLLAACPLLACLLVGGKADLILPVQPATTKQHNTSQQQTQSK